MTSEGSMPCGMSRPRISQWKAVCAVRRERPSSEGFVSESASATLPLPNNRSTVSQSHAALVLASPGGDWLNRHSSLIRD